MTQDSSLTLRAFEQLKQACITLAAQGVNIPDAFRVLARDLSVLSPASWRPTAAAGGGQTRGPATAAKTDEFADLFDIDDSFTTAYQTH